MTETGEKPAATQPTERDDELRQKRLDRLEKELDETIASARRHLEAARYWRAVARARGE